MPAPLTYQLNLTGSGRSPATSVPVFVAPGITEMMGDYGFFRVFFHRTRDASYQLWSGHTYRSLQILPDQPLQTAFLWNCLGICSFKHGSARAQPLPQGLYTFQSHLPGDAALELPVKGSYTWLLITPVKTQIAGSLPSTIPSLLEEQLIHRLFNAVLHEPFDGMTADVAFSTLLRAAVERITRTPVIPIHIGADRQLLGKILETIVLEIDQPLTTASLAIRFNLSKSTLISLFKNGMGITPAACISQWRIEKAVHLLEENVSSIQHIALACGFAEAKYFSTAFHKQMGCSPRNYRRRKREA